MEFNLKEILIPSMVKAHWMTFAILIIPFAIIIVKNLFHKFCSWYWKYLDDKAYHLEYDALPASCAEKEENEIKIEGMKKRRKLFRKISEFITYRLSWDCDTTTIASWLYFAFWFIGGVLMTVAAVVWLLYGFCEVCDQKSKLLEAQEKYNNIMAVIDDPNELTLKNAEELNEFFRQEEKKQQELYLIKPEVVKECKSKFYINENYIRAKLVKKYSCEETMSKFYDDKN